MKKPAVRIVNFMALLLLSSGPLFAFRDIDPRTRESVEELSSSGISESFIFKFGDTYFRPDGNVARVDLILVLHEYFTVISRLFEQNSQLLSRLERVEGRGLSSAEMDRIIREFQRNLEPMLQRSTTISSLKSSPGTGAVSGEVIPGGLVKEVEDLRKEVEALALKLPEMDNRATDKAITEVKKNIETLALKLDEIDTKATDKEIKNLKREIAGIKRQEGREYASERKGADSALISPDSLILPFWARVSIGFSALTLLFMAR